MSEDLFPSDGDMPRLPADGECTPLDPAIAPASASQDDSLDCQGKVPEALAQQAGSGVDAAQEDVLEGSPCPPPDDDDVIGLGGPDDDDEDPRLWPDPQDEPDPELLAWGTAEYPGGDDAEHAAWVASMPDEVRADYLAGPYTGAGEAIPPGFTHREPGGPCGAGFAAGGTGDQSAPGPWLAAALADVTAAGHDKLGESELIGVLLAWQRQVAWSQAGLAATVSAVVERRRAQAARPGWGALNEHVADELAVALTLTSRSASRLMDIAAGLTRLPQVAAALEVGVIDWPRASILTDELAVLPDDVAAAIASRLLERAGEQTTGQLRAAVARAVLAADPAAAHQRQTKARKDTRVEMWHEPSGNAALAGRELAPADAIAADAALTADAGWLRDNGMPGTLAELRAAAYLARLSRRDLADLLPSDHANPDTSPADDRPDSTHSPGRTHNPGSTHSPGSTRSRGGSASTSGHGRPDPADNRPGGSPIPGDRGRTSSHRSGSHDSGCPADNDAAGSGSPAGRSAGPGGTGPGGLRGGTIHLTMPLAALAGLSDAPGEVAGYGPADAGTCRDLATRIAGQPATRWCLTLTGPDGRAAAHACARGRGPAAGQPLISWAAGLRDTLQLLETGTCRHPRHSPGYPWPPALRHLIETRQRTCAAPGCRRPATRCDIDHTIPHDQNGPTCECNGAPLCRRHHRAKQTPGWHLEQPEPGHMTWQLPSGREYHTTGDPY